MAYVRADDVWIFDLDRGLDVALTEGGSGQHNPIWSPYGTHIVYRSGDDIMVRPVDRSTVLEPVTSTDQPDNPIEWLADGTLIVSTEGARSWADLPAAAVKYVRRVEELIRCPVALLSTSPERDDTILVTDPFAD